MGLGGFERPPVWAVVVMVVSAVGLILGGVLHLNRPAPPGFTTTAGPAETSEPVPPEAPPDVSSCRAGSTTAAPPVT